MHDQVRMLIDGEIILAEDLQKEYWHGNEIRIYFWQGIFQSRPSVCLLDPSACLHTHTQHLYTHTLSLIE